LDDKIAFLGEAINYGIIVLAVSTISDRLYFGFWTFPPYQWLSFNISLDLAVFYGRNDWHYYLSQGLPLLLTTYLPFALAGLWDATTKSGIQFLFATTIFTTLGSLSLISHKEVRFIYPLLPLLHTLAAPAMASFFYTTKTVSTHPPPFPSAPKSENVSVVRRKSLLALLLLLNVGIASYTTLIHQSGVISTIKYIRSEYEALALDQRGVPLSSPEANKHDIHGIPKVTSFHDSETFVGFLMPCHSTPWRSQLFYPGLKAWALTCEPPLDIPAHSKERAEYRDEADRFYDDPVGFLKREINTRERPWPRYIVGFEGIEGHLRTYYEDAMKGFRVKERWRTKNSDWHDDWRRKGDVIVWEFVDGSKMEEEVESG
jgi:phosphatidylinositol glycan class B